MDNEFLTMGIEDDRWLKAERLSNRFVTELRAELERLGNEIVVNQRELFPTDASPRWNHDSDASNGIAFARVQYRMNRVNHNEPDPEPLRFNYGLRWDDPAKYDHPGNGAICIPRYKIKNAPEEDFQQVAEKTRGDNQDIQSGPDPHRNAPGNFYVLVSGASEIGDALRTLQDHFGKYGDLFGVELPE